MKFTTLAPKVFYFDIKVGLELFVNCLGFQIVHDDLNSESQPFCIVKKDSLKVHLFESAEFAAKDRPEFHLETTNIEEVFKAIENSFPNLLHPNGRVITTKPWGSQEFALLDPSGVCIVIQQF